MTALWLNLLLRGGYTGIALLGTVLTAWLYFRRRQTWRAVLQRAQTDEFTAARLTAGLRRDADFVFHFLRIRIFQVLLEVLLGASSIATVWTFSLALLVLTSVIFFVWAFGSSALWTWLAWSDLRADHPALRQKEK